MNRRFLHSCMVLLFLTALPLAASNSCSIPGNFNGKAIGAGDYVWFNAVVSVQGLGSTPATVSFSNSTLQFSVEGVPQNISVPGAELTFSPNTAVATTAYSVALGAWTTQLPLNGLSGNAFLTAVAIQVPASGWPRAISPIVWSGDFSASAPGITAQWQWAGAVYTQFSRNLNSLGVKPVDDLKASLYQNSDRAGTPEYFKTFVTSEGTGTGIPNYTGTYGGSAACAALERPAVFGFTNAASYLAGPITPGEIVSIFGSAMGPLAPVETQLDSQGRISTTLEGTQVLFNGIPAPLLYASPWQINAIVPYSAVGSHVQVQVFYQGATSIVQTVSAVASSPGVFTFDENGQGQAVAANQDGTLNSASHPALPGEVVTLITTGEGQTLPRGVDGKLAAPPLPYPALPVSVAIGGIPAIVAYAGAAPGQVAGVMQVNVVVPAGMPPGNAPLVLTVGTASSQPGVTIAVN